MTVYGDLALGGTVNPNFLGTYKPAVGEWLIATATGNVSGSMAAPDMWSVKTVGKNVYLTLSYKGTVFLIR